MAKYIILCMTDDTRTERKSTSLSGAQRIYNNAVKSGLYTSVTMRTEKKNNGHAIKSWSPDTGEILAF